MEKIFKRINKAAIQKDGKYLLTLRSPKAVHLPLYWDFPGGKMESGETPEQAIRREIKEETSLDAGKLREVGHISFGIDDEITDFHIYEAESFTGEVKISFEHIEAKWAAKEEIMEMEKLEPYIVPYFTDKLQAA